MTTSEGLRSDATVMEATEALLLYGDPLLGTPFQEWLCRQAGTRIGRRLHRLPEIAAGARRAARRGALEWACSAAGSHADEYVARCERRALQGFFILADRQACVGTWMARRAPTDPIRARFATASDLFAEVTRELRDALAAVDASHLVSAWQASAMGCAQEETRDGDLRWQVGRVVEALRAVGKRPERIVLSPTALRHLRDQGCVPGGDGALFGVPVAVDFGWPTSSFAVETGDLRGMRDGFEA